MNIAMVQDKKKIVLIIMSEMGGVQDLTEDSGEWEFTAQFTNINYNYLGCYDQRVIKITRYNII